MAKYCAEIKCKQAGRRKAQVKIGAQINSRRTFLNVKIRPRVIARLFAAGISLS